MAREADFALKQFQYDKFTVQSALVTYGDFEMTFMVPEENGDWKRSMSVWEVAPESAWIWKGEDGEQWSVNEAIEVLPAEWQETFFRMLAGEISLPAAFFAEDGRELYSDIGDMDMAFLEKLSEGNHTYQFRETPEGSFVLVGCLLDCGGLEMTFGAEEGELREEESEKGSEKRSEEESEKRSEEESEKEKPREVMAEDLQAGNWHETRKPGRNMAAGDRVYFVTQWDVTKTLRQQELLRQYFLRCYLAAVTVGMVLLGLLSGFLTGPLKRMARAAGRMAQGDYEERLAVRGRDEIGELAERFNQMAGAVEEKVEALSKAAREKEDFVANFAHEMKTPMTSIVGYADMLYQRELSRKEVRDASWYIWNEGMRLEALSLKLMDLTVLGRQEFPLQEMEAGELLADVAGGLEPFFQEKGVAFELQAQPGYVRVEYDLLKTLLINLMDNSVKADCTRLVLQGEMLAGAEYRICVRDNGCGMEEEVLSRITEAFYMVDKARSRKQHGAGLGLALADRIARIHGSELQFQSRIGVGTEVSLVLSCGEERVEDEE